MTYYTIRHCDTHEALGMGGPLDFGKAKSILSTRKRDDKGTPFVLTDWYVTAWSGDDLDEILEQTNAEEFIR